MKSTQRVEQATNERGIYLDMSAYGHAELVKISFVLFALIKVVRVGISNLFGTQSCDKNGNSVQNSKKRLNAVKQQTDNAIDVCALHIAQLSSADRL
jgi:hypothetical protein